MKIKIKPYKTIPNQNSPNQTKILDLKKKFLVRNKFWLKENFGQKKFGKQKFLSEKVFGQKKYLLRKYVWSKNCENLIYSPFSLKL